MSKIKPFFFSHRYNLFDFLILSLASSILVVFSISPMSVLSWALVILIGAFISAKMSTHSCGVQKEGKQ